MNVNQTMFDMFQSLDLSNKSHHPRSIFASEMLVRRVIENVSKVVVPIAVFSTVFMASYGTMQLIFNLDSFISHISKEKASAEKSK